MNTLRDDIYSTIESSEQTTYSLEALANKYRTTEPVIRVQLERLKDEGKKLKITDEEVSILLDHQAKIWPFVFWVFVGLIFSLFFTGVING